MTEISRLSEHIYRIRHCNGRMPRESLLSKYNIINLIPDGVPAESLPSETDGTAVLERGYRLEFSLETGENGGFSIRLPLEPDERLYGLGDESRDCLEKHGKIALSVFRLCFLLFDDAFACHFSGLFDSHHGKQRRCDITECFAFF